MSMLGKIKVSRDRTSGGRSLTSTHVMVLVLCSVLASGCTGQKLDNPFAKLGLGKKSELEATDPGLDPTKTASIATKSPFELEADAVEEDGKEIGPFPKGSLKNNPDWPWVDGTVTGSVEPSISSEGEGRSKLERIANTVSASCRRILAEAGIETTMLRSPTLNGSVNSDEDLSLGASYDLLDLHRANLTEELAAVRCARDDAAAKLAQLLVTSSHSHSQAGYRAKADHLKASSAEIASIKRDIDTGLEEGDLTVFRATALRQGLRNLESEAARAEGEANKRHIVRRIQGQSYKDLDTRLAEAEQRMQEIESKMRSSDGLKFKTSIGYSKRGEGSDDVTISQDGEVTAKFSVAVRLGAYSPRRYELEDIALRARSEALHETNRGLLWRSQEAARVNKTVVGSLQQQRAKLMTALSAAQENARAGAGGDQSELLDAALRGRIEVVRLSAELAAMNATFADSGYLNQKLTFQR
ncbi:MAG: hypothetical protein HRU27_12285 [Rhizobiaceae bacterium]|nr:hypothetical protein [Rhizobiaceae bacterium]